MLGKIALGIFSIIGANQFLKDKSQKSKEEIKDDIRKGTDTISKYASAIYEVANEKINNIQYKTEDNYPKDEELDYFKNVRKDNQE